MGRKKLYSEGPRKCVKCNKEESAERPFPPKGNQCKQCVKGYNTEYQRKRRGHKPRDEKLSPEQLRQNNIDRNKRWRAANPEKFKESQKKYKDRLYSENAEAIKKRNSEWEKRNPTWRQEYNKKRRETKKLEQEQ